MATVTADAQHRADMFLDLDADPREGGPRLGDERTTLTEFLRCQRLTLQLKCEGLDAEQLARRAVEPSTLSLLGLLRHLAEVERGWFRRRFATDLSFVGTDSEGGQLSLRELLVHMVEEYARHNGHADLLRERIDGRLGQ
jgi:uncharacterized damage-inducible protein DinB